MNRLPRACFCKASAHAATALRQQPGRRAFSRAAIQRTHGARSEIDIELLLSRPTWSVSSLLPANDSTKTQEVSPQQLRHLLRLSALPPPVNEADEQTMLSTLQSQLHFVKQIQEVDTSGVEPLRSLRDETAQGERDGEIGTEALKEALELEETVGKKYRRIRRRIVRKEASGDEWDVLGCAERKVGRYFVVEGGKEG